VTDAAPTWAGESEPPEGRVVSSAVPASSASIDAHLASALFTTGAWGVSALSASVVAPTGTLATVGDDERAFDLASVTKLLAAYACLVAVEEGTLTLDEPAGPPGSTVRHLLAHAAGFGFDTGSVMLPGRRRVYSNTGFEALAAHLTAAAGMPADRYVSAAVLEPLGMTATRLRNGSLAHSARSTGRDMARFARELLVPTLIAPSTLAEAVTVAFAGLDGILPGIGRQTPNDWGLGFELRDHKSPHWTGTTNSPETFGHFGASGTCLWVDPALERALVVLTNRDFGPWAMRAWPQLSDDVIAALRS